MSNLDEALIYVHEKGYYVDNNGVLLLNNIPQPVQYIKGHTNYYALAIKHNNKVRKVMIHRLQAYQKYGDKIFDKTVVVRHLNGNSLDNSYDNIAIGSFKDNAQDIPKKQRVFYAQNAASYRKKYNYEEVYFFYRQTKSYTQTMKQFGITSKGTLNYILNKYK